MKDEYILVEDVARILRISVSRVHCRLSQGSSMPDSIRIGRRRLFKKSDVIIWLEKFNEGGDK